MWRVGFQRMKPLFMLASLQLLLLAVCLHSGMSAAAAACFAPDRVALRELASAFLHSSRPDSIQINPADTTAFVGWEGEECCSWHGVVCKGAGVPPPAGGQANYSSRVSKLLLSGRNLVGTIPPAVCAFSALSTLQLADNFLIDSIPLCLSQNLTNLRQLDLSGNFLNGTIPTSFSGLLHLRSLRLGGYVGDGSPVLFRMGGFWGSLSPISALPRLTYLDVSENLFESIPPFKSPRLQWLLLNGALSQFVAGPSNIPVFTNGTPNLKYLDLGGNPFQGGISNLSSFPLLNLQHLDLSRCQNLAGEIPVTAITSNFPRLRTLLLSFTSLPTKTPQIFELICGLKSLEAFEANNADGGGGSKSAGQMSGEMPHQLPGSCYESPPLNLSILDLSNNQLQGLFPPWMSLFPNLQVLDLSGNNVYSSAIPTDWQNLTQLSYLRLSGPRSSALHPATPPLFFPQHMQIWLFRLPLQFLRLSSIGLTNQHVACSHLSLLNTTLKVLDLSANLLTGSHALSCLAHNNFTALHSLSLAQNALAFNLGLTIPPSLMGELSLSSCQLEGELADQFFEMLRHIEGSVSLAHNYFSGNLPLGIGTLLYADSLDLSYNSFTGPIPPSLGNLSYLRYLILENNQLDGEIPEEIGGINYLYLRNNQLTKFRRTFQSATEVLDLSYNRLEADLVQTFFSGNPIAPLQNLIVLLLDHNQLTGELPGDMGAATKSSTPVCHYLSIIGLSGNLLTGTIPDNLFAVFPTLTTRFGVVGSFDTRVFSLVAKNLQLTYANADPFGFPAYLDLSQNRLHGSIPESLGNLNRLSFLNLSRNQLTGSIPSSLANISNIESLDLSYNRLEGPIPSSLSQLSGLGVFNVSFNKELKGPIPMNSPQLQDNSSYIGDPELCGDPYLRSCSSSKSTPGHQKEDVQEIDKGKGSGSLLKRWVDEWIAVPGLCLGIVVGFAGALWMLIRWMPFI